MLIKINDSEKEINYNIIIINDILYTLKDEGNELKKYDIEEKEDSSAVYKRVRNHYLLKKMINLVVTHLNPEKNNQKKLKSDKSTEILTVEKVLITLLFTPDLGEKPETKGKEFYFEINEGRRFIKAIKKVFINMNKPLIGIKEF